MSSNSVLLFVLDEVVLLKNVELDDNGISLLDVLIEVEDFDELELTELSELLELSEELLVSSSAVVLELEVEVVRSLNVEDSDDNEVSEELELVLSTAVLSDELLELSEVELVVKPKNVELLLAELVLNELEVDTEVSVILEELELLLLEFELVD